MDTFGHVYTDSEYKMCTLYNVSDNDKTTHSPLPEWALVVDALTSPKVMLLLVSVSLFCLMIRNRRPAGGGSNMSSQKMFFPLFLFGMTCALLITYNGLVDNNKIFAGQFQMSTIWNSILAIFQDLEIYIAICFIICGAIFKLRQTRADRSKKALERPKDEATFFNDLLLNQALGLVKIGFCRKLTENYVPKVSPWERCKTIYSAFGENWQKEQQKTPRNKRELRDAVEKNQENSETTSSSQEVKPNLLIVLLKTFGLRYFSMQLFLCCLELCNFLSPVLMEGLMKFLENRSKEPMWRGYTLVMAMFFSSAITQVIYNRVYFSIHRMSRHICLTLKLAVFKKALTVTVDSREEKTTGELITLITEDCYKCSDASTCAFYFMLIPLEFLLSMFLLYNQLGASSFAGLGILLAVVPLNLWITQKLTYLEEVRDEMKDQRIKIMNEILNGIKVLKLYAWEKLFIENVSNVRNKEIAVNKRISLFHIYLDMMYLIIPLLVHVTGFMIFLCLGGKLDPAKAFVATTLFSILHNSLNNFAHFIPSIVQAKISLRRLNDFLHKNDIAKDVVIHDKWADSEVSVNIDKGEFKWTPSGEHATLQGIDMDIAKGSFVAVVGSVGTGKSSLLSAIMGQMHKSHGTVNVQEAWMQNLSIRENIVFGTKYISKKYQTVIEACALTEDFKILNAADDTEIGEKGINLSGGQKQRISLARALYNNADIYLLDDPLSAVDAHVGKHIFNQVLGSKSLLKDKTRILVTHGVHWLPFVDEIIVMRDGKICETGTYEKLLYNNGDFAQFLRETFKQSSGKSSVQVQKMRNSFMERFNSLNDKQNSASEEDPVLSCEFGMSRTDQITSHGEFTPLQSGEDEESEKGSISLQVYNEYLKAFGRKTLLSIFVTFVIWMVSSNFKAIWLGEWTEDTTQSQLLAYTSNTFMYMAVYIAVGGLEIVMCYIFLQLVKSRSLDAANHLHNQLLINIMKAPMTFFDTTPTGQILSRFSKDVRSVDGLGDCLDEYMHCVGGIIMKLAIIIYVNPKVTPFIIIVSAAFILLQRLFSKSASQLRRFKAKSSSPIVEHFKEALDGMTTIRAYRAQKRFITSIETTIENHLRFDVWEMFVGIWFDSQIALLSSFVVLSSGLFILWDGDISPAQAGLVLMYSSNFVNYLGWFMTHSTHTEQELVSLERILEFSRKPTEAVWEIPETAPSEEWPQNGQVTMEDYKARYREDLDLVLKGVTCHIKSGEKIGIVGRTGAGKSTLVMALFRMMEATTGHIAVDNYVISSLGIHDLRRKLTILPQDPVIFGGSLRMNIDPRAEKSNSELLEVLKQAHLQKFVENLPEKLDHHCGEGGKNLSVGQRQLVCLARCLLRKTKVLVLDEATASVDIETDDLIQKTICREFKDCTVLTIAHRLNTVLEYDRILVMDNGMVKEFDTPTNLLADKESSFYAMARDSNLVKAFSCHKLKQ